VRPAALIGIALAAIGLGGVALWADSSGSSDSKDRGIPDRASEQSPPEGQRTNVYAQTGAGKLAASARGVPYRVYVPNSESDTVDVIDPERKRIVRSFPVGGLPQHVTPAPGLDTLYVNSNQGNTLTRIDPRTARPKGEPISVEDPYNLYFTPDGGTAIVVAERLMRLDFRRARDMRLEESLSVPCRGVNHLDFSADGSYFIASCEFGSALIKVDTQRRKLIDAVELPRAGMPQDVRISPDGERFYAADMQSHGVWVIDGDKLEIKRLLPTGLGAHGLQPSRDGRSLYVSNRGEGSISVLDFATRKIKKTWQIPGGGSPDMGGVSPDGRELWLSGRYDGEIYAIDTRDGKLRARIQVGSGPHGLAVWPQPGRYSLGHTGNMR
jgi:YVTN family beta-propeller protein